MAEQRVAFLNEAGEVVSIQALEAGDSPDPSVRYFTADEVCKVYGYASWVPAPIDVANKMRYADIGDRVSAQALAGEEHRVDVATLVKGTEQRREELVKDAEFPAVDEAVLKEILAVDADPLGR